MSLGPVVPGAGLPEDEVVGAEDLPERARTNAVHRAWLEVDEHGTWDVLPTAGLVVVDGDAFQLELGVAIVCTRRLDPMFVGNDLPKL